MKKITGFMIMGFIIVGLIIIMVGCSGNKDVEIEVILLSPEEGKTLLDEEEIILIDVRTDEEYKDGHIPESINIPLDVIESEIENQVTNLDQSIIVYCRSGNRSATAGEILINLGYKKVFDLGGIINWPYEVEK